ncbi:TetR family transcriptional regulator [Nocardiopsis tropica]|uniref:TetR family transcriptional regulator n=1 Tax=Streptomonospora nanhaiensis TaxID=1323731 RepID=A0ABY6YLS0_9ACTN|nr:TetR/AcrR family transcriptional regulator [Streptomonospora nanhaiensis]MEE2047833.1 TetR family transcriptional regulator [Nocardiopsis tropica]WAE73164.1 TetR family transcriptional regulator [Streptomonospora nanhaiensis]
MQHPPDTLHARKRRKARAMIVSAAFQLFAEHGFDNVTVASIAERAEVGRTTFFRYFGDKQQVLFADDDAEVDRMCAYVREKATQPIGDDLHTAVGLLREANAATRPHAALSPAHSAVLVRLLAESTELRSRYLLTQHQRAVRLAGALVEAGTPENVAVLAAHTAMACELTAMRLSETPEAFGPRLDEAHLLLRDIGRQAAS